VGVLREGHRWRHQRRLGYIRGRRKQIWIMVCLGAARGAMEEEAVAGFNTQKFREHIVF
jgi:hypothetical protein